MTELSAIRSKIKQCSQTVNLNKICSLHSEYKVLKPRSLISYAIHVIFTCKFINKLSRYNEITKSLLELLSSSCHKLTIRIQSAYHMCGYILSVDGRDEITMSTTLILKHRCILKRSEVTFDGH